MLNESSLSGLLDYIVFDRLIKSQLQHVTRRNKWKLSLISSGVIGWSEVNTSDNKDRH